MIEPNIYCKVSGMVLQCAIDNKRETGKFPSVIEIGCADGLGTMRYAGFCEKVIAIDAMVQGRPDLEESFELTGAIIDKDKINTFISHIRGLESYNHDGEHKVHGINLIVGLSLSSETIGHVTKLTDGNLVDILLIDGAHHPAEAVIADLDAYARFVRPGGFVIFDDTYEPDVMAAVDKAKTHYGMTVHDEFNVEVPEKILQGCIALRTRKV